MGRSEVLVAPGTDPAWTPLFLRASALVMETGGIISRGAIVAREYGIPAVINGPGALDLITDGAEVLVDGDEGRVYLPWPGKDLPVIAALTGSGTINWSGLPRVDLSQTQQGLAATPGEGDGVIDIAVNSGRMQISEPWGQVLPHDIPG